MMVQDIDQERITSDRRKKNQTCQWRRTESTCFTKSRKRLLVVHIPEHQHVLPGIVIASSLLNALSKRFIFYQGCLPTGHMVRIEYLLVPARLHSPTTSSQHFCFTEAEWGELSDGEKGAKTSLMEGDRQVSHFHTNCFKAWFFNHF